VPRSLPRPEQGSDVGSDGGNTAVEKLQVVFLRHGVSMPCSRVRGLSFSVAGKASLDPREAQAPWSSGECGASWQMQVKGTRSVRGR